MTATVGLRATVKLPAMPNFLELEGIEPSSLDSALAMDAMRIDVGMLDDQAIADFCNAWTLAFTRHVKARRDARKYDAQG